MTPIEELVREALSTTLTSTTTTDPLVSLECRVRRARRWLAAGAGAVAAAVVAAVVVPLAVLGGPDAGKVDVVTTPTPSSSSSALPGVERLWTNGATWVSGQSGEQPWLLVDNGDDYGIAQVKTEGRAVASFLDVPAPADRIVVTPGTVWVIGTESVGGTPTSRVTAVDRQTYGLTTATYDSVTLGAAAAVGDSLYVGASDAEGGGVDRLALRAGKIGLVAAVPLPDVREIVATGNDHVWVHSDDNLVELIPAHEGADRGAKESWGGPLLAAAGQGTVWSTDAPDRAVELDPTALEAGTSVALSGKRLTASGRPTALAVDLAGGVYVAVAEEVDYFAPDVDFGPVTARLPASNVLAIVASPDGGVDYVDSQGTLNHWDPSTAESR